MSLTQKQEEALFRAAVEMPADKRPAFLDAMCEGDAVARKRLETMLAAHDKPDSAPSSAGRGPAGTIKIEVDEAPDEAIGQTLGHYKLLEKVGEGGCGVVYVADQTQPVRRRVALKVIKLGMDTKAVVARFEAERQALAMMDHPNIAKVLDAGTTEQGRPFFVMELVRGIRITDYCDQNNLTATQRIDLFIKVCQAIQHAHQKGIIHRDIKPSNILVTLHDGVPVPKVIDFGIAKATEGRLTDQTVYTQLHQFVGTPAYMSPEQAEMSGLDIDTRSDIYSLGVLLYELLVGSTPFDGGELVASGLDAMRKTIREKEPVRPSTRFATLNEDELTTTAKRRSTEISRLMHQLKGDLDWIVMKCLEKDRTRRYETANGLAVDLKRHLDNEPVLARPPSVAYKFQKAFRRNKIVFTAGCAVALALLLGIVATTLQSIRATRAKQEALASKAQAVEAQANEAKLRQQADAARNQAEGLVGFMIQDLQPALKDYGRLSVLKQVDEKVVSYYEGLPPELRNAKTELARADALEAQAEILQASGDAKVAALKFGEALALYRDLAQKHPEIPEAAAGALQIEWNAYAYGKDSGHSSADLDVFQNDVLRRWRELYERFPKNRQVRTGLGGALWNRAELDADRFGKPKESVAVALELHKYVQRGLSNEPENMPIRMGYANALAVLSIAYTAVGDQAKALQVSEDAVAFYDKALKDDPGNLNLLANAAEASQNLSYRVAYLSQKRSRDAELVARERYRLLTSLDPSNADWRYHFVMTHMMECYYLEGYGDIETTRKALKTFDSLLQDLARRGEIRPWDTDKLPSNSIELARLAAMAGDKADVRNQLAVGESRFQTRYDQLPAGSFDRIQARIRWMNLKSGVFWLMQDWAALEEMARETLAIIADGLDHQPSDSELLVRRALSQFYLGAALVRQGNATEAVPILEQSLNGFRDTPPVITFTDDRETLTHETAFFLAESLAKTGNIARARSLSESTLAAIDSDSTKVIGNKALKGDLAECMIQLAGLLDPAKPDEAARRQSLLDRAEAIVTNNEVISQTAAPDKELLAKIAALRGAAGIKEKPESKQP